ncbi:MAG: ATP-binding protein [Deltaproteobacteria bacterium]|nr:ATP-binding protein [Deltaproteobacteria bacterium]
MEFSRILNLPKLLEKKSFFLFGPRSTGKSYLIRSQLSDGLLIDLLDGDTFLRLSAHPSELEAIVAADATGRCVIIDEIQKVPLLLDQVHRIIENQKRTFLLTGSSARKLKRGAANLLAGRAWQANLFSLVYPEIPNFNLETYLRFGGLPIVVLSSAPHEELRAYVRTYLYEEIQAEGIVRKIPQFARFLQSAALSNAQLLNFANISSDSGVSASTVREYYAILEDTLVGFFVQPWLHSKKRKAIATAKFYFFDTGVVHTLANTKTLDRNSDLYGQSFEHWIAMELRAFINYHRKAEELTFWRSVNGQEVDFVIGDQLAIEVKATKTVSNRDLNSLRAFQEENIVKQFFCVSQDPLIRKVDGILCLPWQEFLAGLWQEEWF